MGITLPRKEDIAEELNAFGPVKQATGNNRLLEDVYLFIKIVAPQTITNRTDYKVM